MGSGGLGGAGRGSATSLTTGRPTTAATTTTSGLSSPAAFGSFSSGGAPLLPLLPPLPDVSAKQLVELLVHAADLSNPTLPSFPVVQTWALKVCDEFTAQAAAERAAGFPCAPHMEGLATLPAIAKLQLGFIDYVCSPLWVALTAPEALLPELADAALNLARNRGVWKTLSEGGGAPSTPAAAPPEAAAAAAAAAAPPPAAGRVVVAGGVGGGGAR